MTRPETPGDSPLTMEQALASTLYRDLATPKLAAGDSAYLFELPRLDLRDGTKREKGEVVRLADVVAARPVALVFGSHT